MDQGTVATTGADPMVVGGRYELGALLGTGASAVVRRASDRISGRTFAVKLFHVGASAHDRRRQQREMRALATLHHPGLVAPARRRGGGRPPVHRHRPRRGPHAGRAPREGPARPGRRAAHRRPAGRRAGPRARGGIVHRDLKPANVLLGADGPRLADFGIARALDGTAVTGTGYVVGTAAYLAPEQVRGEWVGPEADVYALGLVLLEALTGRREYPGALVESATARLHRPPGIPDHLPFALRLGAAGDDGAGSCGPADRGRRRGHAGRRVGPARSPGCPPPVRRPIAAARRGGDRRGRRGGGDDGRTAVRRAPRCAGGAEGDGPSRGPPRGGGPVAGGEFAGAVGGRPGRRGLRRPSARAGRPPAAGPTPSRRR